MKEVYIGSIIRKRRQELGLTQEQLCRGICETVTLSRIENGKQTPSRSKLNALLQRLGMPGERYYALLSEQEMKDFQPANRNRFLQRAGSAGAGFKKTG